jgi:glycosyltransferase involved in cell wall biosynthesis
MKIVHISTLDNEGGAARAAFRLHKGLIQMGHDSCLLVSRSVSFDQSVITFNPPSDILKRLKRILRRELIRRNLSIYKKSIPEGYEVFRTDQSEHQATLLDQIPQCEVIHLHWIAGFVDYNSFFSSVPNHTPVIWTIHDMNPFTGGCHYDDNCGKYRRCCGACPQLGSTGPRDLSYKTWQRKQEVMRSLPGDRLSIVAPSRWLAEEAAQSPLFSRFRVERIPNGVNIDDFRPRDKAFARDLLGVPQSAKVLLFVSDWLNNRRKGFAFLSECLTDLNSEKNLYLLSIGQGSVPVNGKLKYISLGQVQGDRFLSLVYSAADLFVIPSLQDNLPTTVLEALACGTPVAGFETGGIPDMVRPGLTGLLAPVGNPIALRNVILQLMSNPGALKDLSANCRRIAETEYSLETQAKKYAELYEQVRHL